MSAPPTSLRSEVLDAILAAIRPADDYEYDQCQKAADAVLGVLRERVKAMPNEDAFIYDMIHRRDVLALLGEES